jgi:hypothetical protein
MAPEPCSIAVLYDDAASRGRAIQLCDHLIRQFWQDMQFRVNWWRTSHLEDADVSQAAAWSLRHARIVILAAVNRTEMPERLQRWLQSALANSTVDVRMFVAIAGELPGFANQPAPIVRALQKCATTAGMDFLPRLTPEENLLALIDRDKPASAAGMSNFLSAILDQPHPPPSGR